MYNKSEDKSEMVLFDFETEAVYKRQADNHGTVIKKEI